MSPFRNALLIAWALVVIVSATACVRKPVEPCGGVHDAEESASNSYEGPDHFIPDRAPQRYVEIAADPNESATNPAPNLLQKSLDFNGIEVKHQLPTEQELWRSIPFYLELPADYDHLRVFLRYKPFGAERWTEIKMQRHEAGRVAEIPCLNVDVTGHLRYYFVIKNRDKERVGELGSHREPLVVQIVHKIKGGQLVIEGRALPTRCVLEREAPSN